jgi:hypothetical protein
LADNFSAQTVLSLASLPALAAAGGMCLLKPAVRWALVHGSPRGC